MGLQPTLYDSLILPLRALDATDGQLLLQRFLERPQYHADRTQELINTLPLTDSPVTCPEALIQYLAPHVGLTSEMSEMMAGLSTIQLRKLLLLAMPFWKKKGTVGSLQAIARHLTGRIPNYISWFDSRLQLDVSTIAEDQQGADSFLSADAYSSCLEMMDDGSINTDLLLALIRLVRPANESLQVTLYDFIDLFIESLDRWTLYSGIFPEIVMSTMGFDDDGSVIPVIPLVGSGPLGDHVIEMQVNIPGAAAVTLYTLDHQPINTHVRVVLQPSAAVNKLYVYVCVSGVLTTLFAGSPVGVPYPPGDCWYTVRLEVVMSGLVPRLKFYFENVLQVESDFVFPPSSGQARISKTGGGWGYIDNVRIWRSPLRYAILGPSGEEISSSF
jgi:hypothetical protein